MKSFWNYYYFQEVFLRSASLVINLYCNFSEFNLIQININFKKKIKKSAKIKKSPNKQTKPKSTYFNMQIIKLSWFLFLFKFIVNVREFTNMNFAKIIKICI